MVAQSSAASSAGSKSGTECASSRRSSAGNDSATDIVQSTPANARPSMSTPSSIVLSSCFFECGNNAATCKLVNIATAKSPKMVCPPCVSSKKAIDKQGQASKDAAKALKELKEHRQGEWKALVRNSRIDVAVSGGSTAAHRERNALLQKVLVSSTNNAESFKEEADTDGALWPDRAEFISYHKNWKNMTEEQATAKWDIDPVDPAIERRGEGNGLRVKVMGIPTSATVTGKRVARGIEAKRTLESNQDLAEAAKRMRTASVANDFDIAFQGGRTRPSARASVGSAAAAQSAVPIIDEVTDVSHIDIKYLKSATDAKAVNEDNVVPSETQKDEDDPKDVNPKVTRRTLPLSIHNYDGFYDLCIMIIYCLLIRCRCVVERL